MPSTQGAPAGAGPAAGGPRRTVVDSYGCRKDVGCCGVYNGNWGGNRLAVLQRHVDVDIAEGAPCHIVTAQEVDPAFVNNEASQGEERPVKVARLGTRPWGP